MCAWVDCVHTWVRLYLEHWMHMSGSATKLDHSWHAAYSVHVVEKHNTIWLHVQHVLMRCNRPGVVSRMRNGHSVVMLCNGEVMPRVCWYYPILQSCSAASSFDVLAQGCCLR